MRPLACLVFVAVLLLPWTAGAYEDKRTVQVWALAYSEEGDGKAVGSCNPMKVTVTHDPSQAFRIGFFESEVGGSGPNWRASGWMAAMVAAQISRFDTGATQFSYDVAGHVDGPSAGGLITVGTLAALRGDNVRQDAAMTGAINPDGTIGPVGGIPHKLEGAGAAGKKLVVIPAVVRRQKDHNRQTVVDLVEHGKSLGLTIRPVVDIYEAYEVMTGKRLPRPGPAPAPELSEAAYETWVRKCNEWLVRAKVAQGQFENLPEEQRYEYVNLQHEASVDHTKRAENLLIEGQSAAAYQAAIDASVYATVGLEVAKMNALRNDRGLDQAKNQVRALAQGAGKLDLTLAQLKKTQPKTLGQVPALCEAYICLSDAFGQVALAYRLLDLTVEDEEQNAVNTLTACENVHYALLNAELIKDCLEALATIGGDPLPADAPIAGVADLYQRAAEASENMLDHLVVDEIAQVANLRVDEARLRLIGKDTNYGLNRMALKVVLPQFVKELGNTPAASYARLAIAVHTYARTSALIAKYYGLDAQLDSELNVTAIVREKTLQNMLDSAEDRLRRAIRLLQEHDVDMTTCSAGYEQGRMYRERDSVTKLDALGIYWRCFIGAEAMAHLGRIPLPADGEKSAR